MLEYDGPSKASLLSRQQRTLSSCLKSALAYDFPTAKVRPLLEEHREQLESSDIWSQVDGITAVEWAIIEPAVISSLFQPVPIILALKRQGRIRYG